jgi:hypothetical protein
MSKTIALWMLLLSIQPRGLQNEVGSLISAAYAKCNILLKQNARSFYCNLYVLSLHFDA